MPHIIYWAIPIIAGMIANYIALPALVGGLRAQAPLEYLALGSPAPSELFLRGQNAMQRAFLWFVLSGQAYARTHGATRRHAVVSWLGYAASGIGFAGYIIQQLHSPFAG